jgi:valyl-tRNA synthetase
MPDSTLPKTYDFRSTEQRLYRWWEDHGWFAPTNDPNRPDFDAARTPFVISIPPPNVTGELHLGHAMFVAVEDLMIRYHRMRGEPTLWVPGADHAGIATQLQVEKDLLRLEEVTREELGREKFVERCWAWKEKYGDIIYDQLRRLGASCDWSRVRFTLDDGLSRAVREAFVRLHEKGLVYRGPRLINWSPGLKTAVSDLEVEYSEEPGTLYYFKYRVKGTDDFLPVATTRPETILGDVAVAVHPDDERYRRLVGGTALVPILDREIPVIADEAVDREFGGGALKITPGHDFTDYEIGARHNLPIISVLDREARVTAAGGPYQGMDRFECRDKLWADMQAAGLTLKTEPYMLNVPRSQRGGEIVEPMVSTQWFVTIEPLAKAALQAVKDGRIRIVPEHFEKVYFNWLDASRIRDWCISRQLWWGHRIPIWYCPDGHMTTGRADPTQCAHCGSTQLVQDPDVLDTWFSSGLWPFSTLGWPDATPDVEYFYPTSVMETGYDILFFWVARMIMFGLEFTGRVPFHTVYLHGIIRDELGRKMSKTLGNVMDPRWIIDGVSGEALREAGTSAEIAGQFPDGISAMGTDALRFTLLTSGTPGNDLNLSLARVEANRNFANKIWNMARFITSNLPDGYRRPTSDFGHPTSDFELADRWILSRLNQTIADCTRLIESYEFGQAGAQAYEFLWGDFADWYIEYAKIPLGGGGQAAKTHTRGLLVHVLDQSLRLLHPYVPYVTEAVWQHLPHTPTDPPALITARWPAPGPVDETALANFGHLRDIIRAIRNVRAEKKVEMGRRIPATLVAGHRAEWIHTQRPLLVALAKLDDARFHIAADLTEKPAARNAITLVIDATEVYLPLESLVDVNAEQERLKKELVELNRQVEKSEGLLASDFAQRAPAAVVARERNKLDALKASRAKLAERLDAMGS